MVLRVLSVLVCLLLGATSAARAEGRVLTRRAADPFAARRGPIEIRDEWMLAQPRLTLPVTSPDVLRRGRWWARAIVDWGNDFCFSQTGPAESPLSDRRFLVDGEHRTAAFEIRRGLGGGWDAGVRLPVHWRGAGVLDPLIDWFHKVTGTMGNSREEFDQNRYRIQGRSPSGRSFDWDDEHGTGLGNAELSLRWSPRPAGTPRRFRFAVVGRVGLPTGTGPFETGSLDLGLQLVAARQVHRRVDIYGGLGGTWYSETETRGFRYTSCRAHGFLAIEWRALSWASLLLQTDVASRMIVDVQDFPGLHWYAYLGAKVDLSSRVRFLLGLTENVIDQQSTLDVGVWAGLEARF